MPHAAGARTGALAPGLGVTRVRPAPVLARTIRKRVSTRTRVASTLITAPVLTELVKLTLSPSSVTNTNTIAAGKLADALLD